MLLFAGCTSSGSGKKNGFELNSFNGGDESLTLEFAENSPPENIRDQGLQPFSIRLLVKNMGEYDIPEGEGFVSLSGMDPVTWNLQNTSKPLMLLNGFKKQGDNVIPGRSQQVIFSDLKYTDNIESGSFPFNLVANLCYPYETKAFALVCINGDTLPSLDEKAQICEIDGDKKFANSGAPVKIANVVQYPYGQSSIQIKFDIVHKPVSTNSNIYEPGSIDSNCNINGGSPSTSSQAAYKRDKVLYTVESDIPGLDCEGTGSNTNTVQLLDDKYTVTCIQDTSGQPEYEKPITITLKYDYWDRISKQIIVEHVG